MQTQPALPATTEKSSGNRVFYAIFGTLLVVAYLATFWIFLNGMAFLFTGTHTTATVTRIDDPSTVDATPSATVIPTVPANATAAGVSTKEIANQYTFHFKTTSGQLIEKAYVTTTYDLGDVGSQVDIIYNPNNPENFIVDGFLPMFFYFGKNCLLFITLTILIVVALVRLRIKRNRANTNLRPAN
ncbi:MAG: hypothetical protein J0I20_13210 [Chloroflexi bacterium]|nr:hypothetical protein [Chloroflexota bacterium]OJV92636.1 MAG: hypothetical protein BGO39_32715 [Chloroflexi bacterium 54-19]